MSNKRIGIMTMHKVLNYGSALQAYALQHHISSTGNDAELIDYIFPNGKRKSAGSIKATIINSVANALVYFPKKRNNALQHSMTHISTAQKSSSTAPRN